VSGLVADSTAWVLRGPVPPAVMLPVLVLAQLYLRLLRAADMKWRSSGRHTNAAPQNNADTKI
jgi:hypothetical protein